MADSTWGVKVSEDFKNEIIGLISDSGKQSKEFMELLITLYKTEILKKEKPQIAQEYDELQVLTKRMCEIFLNSGQRSDNLMAAQSERYEEVIEQYKVKIDEISDTLLKETESRKALGEAFDNLVVKKAEIEQGSQRLNEIVENQKALIVSLNDKIKTLSSTADEYSTYKEKYESIMIEINNISVELKDAKQIIIQKDQLIIINNKNHTEEIKTLTDKLMFEQNKAILDLKLVHQKNMEELQDKYNLKISSLQEKISEYNAKILSLQDKISENNDIIHRLLNTEKTKGEDANNGES